MDTDAPTTIRIEWGRTTALGSTAFSNPTPIGVGVHFSLDWISPPPPGTYYARFVAENTVGSSSLPVFGFTIGPDYTVTTLPPTFPPRQEPPRASLSMTLSSTAPITVAVGDTVDLKASVTTSAGWLFQWPLGDVSLAVEVPGDLNFCVGCPATALDLVSATPTSGSCRDFLRCDFGPLGPSTTVSLALEVRGKTPGVYQLVFEGAGSTVKIPVTVIPRVTDLSVSPPVAARPLRVGKTLARTVTVANNGPESVHDAQLIVGSPRGLGVRASSTDGTCSTAPVRCALKELDSGQTAVVRLTFTPSRSGRFTVPIGVASTEDGDAQTANNAFRYLVTVAAPKRSKSRKR
jgi:hypothetical protein